MYTALDIKIATGETFLVSPLVYVDFIYTEHCLWPILGMGPIGYGVRFWLIFLPTSIRRRKFIQYKLYTIRSYVVIDT